MNDIKKNLPTIYKEKKKGTQLIVEDNFPVKYEIYNVLESRKAEEEGGK